MMKKTIVTLLVMGMLLAGCQKKTKEQTTKSTSKEKTVETITLSEAGKDVIEPRKKEEMVHVSANAYGTPEEITVQATLKNNKTSDLIKDYSRLSDIINKKGDEEYDLKDDGRLLWENHGEDIVYEGTSTDDLPVAVRVSYALDGEEIDAADLAGKSGRVTMRFDYLNKVETTARVDGKSYNMYVPFIAISAISLPGDVFSNVKVENGKLISQEDSQIAVGYAMPGWADNLRLGQFEMTEDIEIPDYVEVTADAQNFELDFTATVFTTGLFDDVDLSDIDDIDDLSDGLNKIDKAFSKIVSGAASLYKGSATFNKYLGQYVQGVSQVSRATSAINNSVQTIKKESESVTDETGELAKILAKLSEKLKDTDLEKLLEDQDMTKEDLVALIGQMQSDAKTLKNGIDHLPELIKQLDDYIDAVKVQRDSLSDLDIADLEDDVEDDAIRAAKKEVEDVMADTSLSDEEKAAIIKALEKGIREGVDLGDFVAKIKDVIKTLSEETKKMEDLDVDLDAIERIVASIKQSLGTLEPFIDKVLNADIQLADIEKGMTDLQESIDALAEGTGALSEGITMFTTSIDTMSDVMSNLNDGTSQLATSGAQLVKVYTQLTAGMKGLSKGLKAFDDQAISKITDLAGDDLVDVMHRLEALQEADDYRNFSGIGSEDGSVTFVIETSEIKTE